MAKKLKPDIRHRFGYAIKIRREELEVALSLALPDLFARVVEN